MQPLQNERFLSWLGVETLGCSSFEKLVAGVFFILQGQTVHTLFTHEGKTVHTLLFINES